MRVDVTINYYALGSVEPLGSQLLPIEIGTEVDFTDASSLTAAGIILPKDYFFSADKNADGSVSTVSYAASGAWGWSARHKFTTNDPLADNAIEVYLVHKNKVPVTFQYLDRAENNELIYKDEDKKVSCSQLIQIEKGATINFSDPASLTSLGIILPDNYTYIAAHCYASAWIAGTNYYQNSFKVPENPMVSSTLIDVYMVHSSNTHRKTVVLISGAQVVGTTYIDFDEKTGSYTFDIGYVRGLNSTFASGTSFSIGVLNTDGESITNDNVNSKSMCEIGNVYTGTPPGGVAQFQKVTAEFLNIYQYPGQEDQQIGYCLANPKMCMYIKMFW